MNNNDLSFKQRIFSGDLAISFYLAIINLCIFLVVNLSGGYGLFRDELYYLACSNNLDLGYVDQPPLSIYILRITTTLLGDSLFAIRLIPALCGAITVFMVGVLTVRMGGGRFATFIASLFSFGLATFSIMGYYSMNSIEVVSWVMAFYLLMNIVDGGSNKQWILLGIVLGLGLLNKIGMLFLGAGLFVGLLLPEHRRVFLTVWPYVTGAISLILFSPYIIWNFQHDFAHLEFIRNASEGKYSGLNAFAFLKGQFLMNNPVGFVVWFIGLIALLASKQLAPYRIFGVVFLTAFFILIINKTSKDIYLLPAYPILWAAGGVWIEHFMQKFKFARYAVVFLITCWAVLTLTLLPVVLPLLPVESYVSYSQRIGLKPESVEGKELGELHQFYADMFGWKEKARDVAAVFNQLSESEKLKCAIFSDNYGRCAAIDYYGREYGLPKTIGNHNNYWIWGPRNCTGEIVIILGGSLEDHIDDFEEVKLAGVSTCDYCMPYENKVGIFIGRRLKVNLNEIWLEDKHYE